jgi:2-polyprenyl-3-methyl-5-hydroxy-6-metoxy-1,4-benzoquinol methylase
MSDYRHELFSSYDRHTGSLDMSHERKIAWFAKYLRTNYLPHLGEVDKATAQVLEVGCNKGYLLKSLEMAGFARLTGIDLSEAELVVAGQIVPLAQLELGDAIGYLEHRPASFDVIIAKAVVEHMPKSDVIPFFRVLSAGLLPGGLALVDVPNMDWLFASHERYMDFTHEVGFTQESLLQTFATVFEDARVLPIEASFVEGRARLKRRLGRYILDSLLSWADSDGGQTPIWARSLLAIGKAPGAEAGFR